MPSPKEDKESSLERSRVRLWDAGIDLAAALAGGAAGLIAGPPGVVAGAVTSVAVAHSLRAVGEEIEERALSPRQHARIGAVFALAAREIDNRLQEGETPRSDGFFDREGERRPDSEELLEGVLLRAGEEYEERKLPFLSRLYAEVCFRETISSGYAHHLLRLADRLSYRQLCLLALFADEGREEELLSLELIRTEMGHPDLGPPEAGVIAEMDQLGTESILGFGQRDETVAHFASVVEGGTFGTHYKYTGIKAMPVGTDLYDLLGLDELPREDVEAVLTDLRGGSA